MSKAYQRKTVYNRDEHVKTTNKMKVRDISVLLAHNVLQS